MNRFRMLRLHWKFIFVTCLAVYLTTSVIVFLSVGYFNKAVSSQFEGVGEQLTEMAVDVYEATLRIFEAMEHEVNTILIGQGELIAELAAEREVDGGFAERVASKIRISEVSFVDDQGKIAVSNDERLLGARVSIPTNVPVALPLATRTQDVGLVKHIWARVPRGSYPYVRIGISGALLDWFYRSLDPDYLVNLLSSFEQDLAFVGTLDHKGRFLSHGDKYEVGRSLPGTWDFSERGSASQQVSYQGERMLVVVHPWDETSSIVVGFSLEPVFAMQRAARFLLFLILLLFYGILSLLIGVSARHLTKPLDTLVLQAENIALGDFTNPIHAKSRDEIGLLARSFEKMRVELSRLIHSMHQEAEGVAQNSSEVAASIDETSASVESVAESANAFSQTVQQTSYFVADLEGLAGEVEKSAKSGGDSLRRTQQGVDAIGTSVDTLNQGIHTLEERSKQIGSITVVIRGIAEETNMLALNAAIEAARAGEEGRGFAIVAEEVRKLAYASAKSTNEIRELVSQIQGDIAGSAKDMEKSVGYVAEGVTLIGKTEAAFATVLDLVHTMRQKVSEVAQSIQALAAGSENIAAATQEQSATLDRIVEFSDHLANTAEALKSALQQFHVG